MPLVNTVDALITFRIIRLLVTPWTSTKAFQLGIIDRDGNPLKKSEELKTSEEQSAYTILDRLIFKLKRLLQNVPLVNRNLTNFAAALWLVKECYERNMDPTYDLSFTYERVLAEDLSIEKDEIYAFFKEEPNYLLHKLLVEDGASAGGAPGAGVPGSAAPIGNIPANRQGTGAVAGFKGDAGRRVKRKLMRRPAPGEPSNITNPLS